MSVEKYELLLTVFQVEAFWGLLFEIAVVLETGNLGDSCNVYENNSSKGNSFSLNALDFKLVIIIQHKKHPLQNQNDVVSLSPFVPQAD